MKRKTTRYLPAILSSFFLTLLLIGHVKTSTGQVVISQVYGGGGNTGAVYTNDFIELFNRGSAGVSLNGWSVQYASAAGTSWVNKIDLADVTLAPGQYYLIQGAGGVNGIALPTPDATCTINLSGTTGKIALVNTTTVSTGTCPTGASILDFVGFGLTANCYEGAGATPAPSNSTSVIRSSNGCTDTDQNAADFTAVAPNPRNTATTKNPCSGGSPTLQATPSSLSGFTYVAGSGPSTSQSYNLSGTNLASAPGNITVSGTTNYEVSINNSTFSASVNVPYASATLASTPVYVRLKAGLSAGSYNSELVTNAGGGATTVNVTCSGSVTAPAIPTLSAVASSLSGFTYVAGSGPSASQSYNLSGTNLTGAPGNITVSGTTNYEVSINNSTFSTSVNVPYASATLASTPVYVRLKAGLTAGNYNSEIITNAGGGATTINVTCIGTVTAAPALSAVASSLSGFTYIAGSGPSTSQSYNLSGSNLTGAPGNITVSGTTNYEVSINNTTFSASVNVPYATATLASTPVYTRLKAGLTAGNYNSEIITNAGGGAITVNVTCSGTVTAIGAPTAFAVTGSGSYCTGGSGLPVGLSGSQSGVTYTLYKDNVAQAPTIAGTGSAISFGNKTGGTYTVKGTNGGGTTDMTGSAIITAQPALTAFNVTGGGSYCEGGSGLQVGLSGSQSEVTYQLYAGASGLGAAIPGTGSALSFGIQASGVYTVKASNSCGLLDMNGSATVTAVAKPVPVITGVSAPCQQAGGQNYATEASMTSYVWIVSAGGSITSGAGTNTITILWSATGNQSVEVSYTNSTGCTAATPTVFTVNVQPAPAAAVISRGVADTLISSVDAGNQWYLNGIIIQAATNKKHKPASNGNYTVVVTSNGCTSAVSNTLSVINVGIAPPIEARAFDIYPNPNNGQFKIRIESAKASEYTIGIYNSVGSKVWSRDKVVIVGTYNGDINLKSLPTGVYTIILRNRTESIAKRVIVMNQ